MSASSTRLASCPRVALNRIPFKRAQKGLYHGQLPQFGNNVPFSKHKTRRNWLPNVQPKHFFSDKLEERVKVDVTIKALKTIRKVGGLDKYLLKTKPDLLGWEGMRLRLLVRDQLRKEAEEAKALADKAAESKGKGETASKDAPHAKPKSDTSQDGTPMPSPF